MSQNRSFALLSKLLGSFVLALFAGTTLFAAPPTVWKADSNTEWKQSAANAQQFTLKSGTVHPNSSKARFTSTLKTFAGKREAIDITLRQTGRWPNWEAVDNIEPDKGGDAPIFVPVGKNNYWYLNGTNSGGNYHAWHSKDLENWTHHGDVTKNNWVTSAEYKDGKFYIYYDEPNDQDPHLIVTDDLTNDQFQDKGEVLADPSHGSDAGIFRDEDGSFHLIYEDWSPLNAAANSWDSPLAGHASSSDGINGFEPHEHPAPIDERTIPLPEFGTYGHSSRNKPLKYHKHKPPQDAFGDYTLVKVGQRYYIFCDYDPHGKPMRIGYWYSDSIYEPFTFGGSIGKGFHPDPTIGFAEGQFNLLVQRNNKDFISSGPWAEQVRARVGVDTNDDQKVDQWTDWQVVSEQYKRKPGFARVVERAPAQLDLSSLPAGHGFRFEFQTRSPDGPNPVMDSVRMTFK